MKKFDKVGYVIIFIVAAAFTMVSCYPPGIVCTDVYRTEISRGYFGTITKQVYLRTDCY